MFVISSTLILQRRSCDGRYSSSVVTSNSVMLIWCVIRYNNNVSASCWLSSGSLTALRSFETYSNLNHPFWFDSIWKWWSDSKNFFNHPHGMAPVMSVGNWTSHLLPRTVALSAVIKWGCLWLCPDVVLDICTRVGVYSLFVLIDCCDVSVPLTGKTKWFA